MTANTTSTEPNRNENSLAVRYDVEPIRIRDPVAEALAVLDPGEPFVIDYEDVVVAAGHSCPTASGAFRIAQLGLEALYPDSLPVRSQIEVLAGGSQSDTSYGVTGNILSYITGAAGIEGFGGLAGGVGDRRNLLEFEAFEPDGPEPTFRFRRTDVDETVQVTYHVGDVPDGGSALGYLEKMIDGSANEEERELFATAWHDRVRAVLSEDDLFTVESV